MDITEEDPTPKMLAKMLAELKDFLGNCDEQGWSVRASRRFDQDVHKLTAGGSAGPAATNRGATGSLPEKKH